MKVKARSNLSDIALVRGHSFISSVLGADSVVVDAGAHRCEFANAVATRFGSRVIALEPNPYLVSEPIGTNVALLRSALSGADGTASLALDENPESSSIVADCSSRPSATTRINVTVRSIASLLEEFGIEAISLLKLDIEGAEFDVIESIDESLASRIHQVTVEFHPANATGHSEHRIVSAMETLRCLGFHMYKASYTGCGDVLFLNSRVFTPPGRLFSAVMPFYRKGLETGWFRWGE